MDKKGLILLGYVAFLAASLFCGSAASGEGTDVLAAKKDRKVMIYGTLETATMDRIRSAFEKKYGIEASFFRASATTVMDKALSEFRSGKVGYDVVLAPTSPMNIMKDAGIFTRYVSPMNAHFPEQTKDKDGILSPPYRSIVIGIVYNTANIKPNEAPQSLADLLGTQWKSRFVMPDPTQHTTTTAWLASLYKVLGSQDKADGFIRGLARQRPVFLRSFVPVAERIASGEVPIGLTFIRYVHFYERKGAHLDYVRLGHYLGDGQNIALSREAPHSNAGKLFIDFFLSEESMKIMAAEGEFVNRKGIYPPVRDADKVRFVQMDDLGKDGFKKKKEEYRRIFFK